MKGRPQYTVQPLKAKGLFFVVNEKGIHQRTTTSLAHARKIIRELVEAFKKFTADRTAA